MTDTFNPAWVPLLASASGTGTLRAREVQFGDGYVQEAGDGINLHLQEWSLSWMGRVGDTIDPVAIRFWLVAHIGQRFNWTPPAGSAGLYACKGNYTLVPQGAGIYQLNATFTERAAP